LLHQHQQLDSKIKHIVRNWCGRRHGKH
jgi:hypothetical protein